MGEGRASSRLLRHQLGPLSRTSPDCSLLGRTGSSPVPCHRLLLAIHSTLLNTILANIDEQEEAVILLPDYTMEELAEVVEVMYGQKEEALVTNKVVCGLGLNTLSSLRKEEMALEELAVEEMEEVEEKVEAGDPSMSFECPECSQLFVGLQPLYSHLASCEAQPSIKDTARQTFFKCSPCRRVFSSIEEINRHVREHHVAGRKVEGEEELGEDIRLEEIEETIITVGGDDKITVETVTEEQKEEEEDRENEGYDVRYMCSQCDQVFMTMSLLESHQATQHSTLPGTTFQCNFCGEKLPTRHEHERHTVEQHNQFIIDQVGQESGRNYFKCSQCQESFSGVKPLTDHMVAVHDEGGGRRRAGEKQLKGRCHLCLTTLLVREEQSEHYRTQHPGHTSQTFMCCQCDKAFRTADFLEKHEKSHRDPRPFQCGACDARFPLASTLHNHVRNCRSIPLNTINRVLLPTTIAEQEKQIFLCITCKTEFPTSAALRQHTKATKCGERKTSNPGLRPIFPKLAGELAAPDNSEVATNQIILQISETDTFEPGVLEGGESLIFEDTSAPLMEPLSSEAGGAEEKGDMLRVVPGSFEHQRIVVLDQNGDPDLSLGPEVLVQSEVVEVDDNNKSKDRKFVCSYCNNRYFAKDHLISHMRTHTGEKPFECEKCRERFMYRSTWSNHRVRCIEGPDGMNKFRKFTCGFCSSSFLARDHLRQHERIHTGEKPWKCAQCGERFQYRNRWKTHVRKCTGSEPVSSKLDEVKNMAHKKHGQFKCSHCDQIFKKTNRLEKHAQSMHPGSKKLSCDLCGDKFAFDVSLREHMEKHEAGAKSEEGGPIMLMMLENKAGSGGGLQTEFGQEQVVECETVFPDTFQGGSEVVGLDSQALETSYFEEETKGVILGHIGEKEVLSNLVDAEVRKSGRKRASKKENDSILVTKRLKKLV